MENWTLLMIKIVWKVGMGMTMNLCIMYARRNLNVVSLTHIDFFLTFNESMFPEVIDGCKTILSNPSACYVLLPDKGPMTPEMCDSVTGYPVRFTTSGSAQEMRAMFSEELKDDDEVWSGLRASVDSTTDCDSFFECGKQDGWQWIGGGSVPPMEIEPSHQAAVNQLSVNGNDPCVRLRGGLLLDDRECDKDYYIMCMINYGASGLGESIAVPKYFSNTFTCSVPPDDPPAESNMKVSDDQPALMCPGKKAKFDCDAGGINVRYDNPFKSSYEIKCKSDQTYDTPEVWPFCVDKLDCSEPTLDETVMNYDWVSGSPLIPPFDVTYECVYPRKKIVLKSDLNAGSIESVVDTLTLSCQDNGTYSQNIEDFTCSRVCPYPSLPEPDVMEVSLNITIDSKPEIFETVTWTCKNGHKLVSKAAFRTGRDTKQLDELMSMCQITGWLNETIGSYTCTRDCTTPLNYTEIFDYDYVENATTVIDTTYNYKCLDSRKKVVNLEELRSDLLDVLEIKCLYNGQWSANPKDFGCTECLRKYDPPNGQFYCESKRYAEGSTCHLKCNPGYIHFDQAATTCLYDESIDDYEWSISDDRLKCVKGIALIIGGIQANYEYTNDVEVFHPNVECVSRPPAYPFKVVGTVSGFTKGQNIVCGGGKMEYADCSRHYEGSWDCGTDMDCVKTQGGARWCTGPKTKECYSLLIDYIEGKEKWTKVIDMREARAYASAAVVPNGDFWITGGVSRSKILDTIEILSVDKLGNWKRLSGPKLTRPLTGHCFAPLNDNEVIVAGGYSPLEDGYVDNVEIYNKITEQWRTRVWMKLKKYGPRFDSTCLSALIGIERKLVMTGGWNNTDMFITEYFDPVLKEWITMGRNDVIRHAWGSRGVRSGGLVDLGQKIYHIGGVNCSPTGCERTNYIHQLDYFDTYPAPKASQWNLFYETLSQAKSSIDVLRVPQAYCNRTLI